MKLRCHTSVETIIFVTLPHSNHIKLWIANHNSFHLPHAFSLFLCPALRCHLEAKLIPHTFRVSQSAFKITVDITTGISYPLPFRPRFLLTSSPLFLLASARPLRLSGPRPSSPLPPRPPSSAFPNLKLACPLSVRFVSNKLARGRDAGNQRHAPLSAKLSNIHTYNWCIRQ